MALTDADKKEIAGLIRAEVEKIKTEIAKPALEDMSFKIDRDPSMSYEEHAESIRIRQINIPDLIMDNNGISAHLGSGLSPGCRACKDNRWIAVFVGKVCNAKCKFCPQPPKPSYKEDDNGIISTSVRKENYSELIIKLSQAVERNFIDAIGYSGGEPLLYLERIIHYTGILNAKYPGLYQYIYTNGKLVTGENLGKLRDRGIKEVRFNLAATEFSEKVIEKMYLSKKIIPFLTIEVPALKGISRKIKENIKKFIDIGVDQINLCEVVINRYNWPYFESEPYYIINPYKNLKAEYIKDPGIDVRTYRRLVPTWSRHETYNVLEMAYKFNWPMVINDCSQAIHYKDKVPY